MKNIWDEIFNDDGFCTDLAPRQFATEALAAVSPAAGAVLDVGCGCGRHLVYLAASGYQAYGIDLSEVALAKADENLRRFGLRACLQNSAMWDIPFPGVQFAAALAINVLNHGTGDQIARSVSAISRRLLPGGIFLITLLTTRDYRASGRRVGTHTFICDKGPEEGVLHTVFDERSARALLERNFTLGGLQTASGTKALANGERVNQEFFQIRAVKGQVDEEEPCK